MLELKSFIHSIRLSNLGGALGAVLGGVVYLRTSAHLSETFLVAFSAYGIALGTALQRAIENLFAPVFKFIFFRGRLVELEELLKAGKIDQETHQRLVDRLVERRFLEDRSTQDQVGYRGRS